MVRGKSIMMTDNLVETEIVAFLIPLLDLTTYSNNFKIH